jgi:preprotein translocase subunit YajC
MKRLMILLAVLAPAVTWAQAATPQQPGMLEALFPFVIMFVILYFVLLRPQMRKQKEHQSFITALKRGDEVITATGILGRIEGLTEQFVTLEIAEGVRVKMLRSQISGSSQSVIQAAQKESSKK